MLLLRFHQESFHLARRLAKYTELLKGCTCVVLAFVLVAQERYPNLKIKKTVPVPLRACDLLLVRKLVVENISTWAAIDIKKARRYLGFTLGPQAGDLSWRGPADKGESCMV